MSELKMGGSATFEIAEDEDIDFAQIRADLEEIKNKEETHELSSGHLIDIDAGVDVDIDSLSDEDLLMWDRIRKGNVTNEEFKAYRKDASLRHDNSDFTGFLSNELMVNQYGSSEIKENKNREAA